MSDLLTISGVSKRFGGIQALDDVGLRVRAGAIAGLIGPNGAGKTTTLKCLLGFIHPDAGSVHFFNGQELGPTSKQQIGYLPERPYLYEHMTVEGFLLLHWKLLGKKAADFSAACEQVLQQVNLSHAKTKKMRSFSKGMLQRIGLAQAILGEPEFLILDEPMSGLDPDGRLMVKDIIRAQQQRGATILFSSHLLQDMDELCSHLLVIDKGHLVFSGPLAQFRREHPNLEEAFRGYQRGRDQ